MKQQSYEMIFVSLPSDIPVDVRLRHVLKSLLRRHEFRCKSIKPIDPKVKRTASKNMGRMAHHGATAKQSALSESGRRLPVAPQTTKVNAA